MPRLHQIWCEFCTAGAQIGVTLVKTLEGLGILFAATTLERVEWVFCTPEAEFR
jgi:hypothetical protein